MAEITATEQVTTTAAGSAAETEAPPPEPTTAATALAPPAPAPSSDTAAAAPEAAAKPKKRGATENDGQTPRPLKPAAASREDNLLYDLKHMAAFDISPLDPKIDFLAYTRDSVQLLVNRIFALPRKDTEVGPSAILPTEETFRLPRQKPIPKEKPKTRWQKFMEERNMKKRKRSKLVFDELSGDWKPRWGYKSIKKSQEAAANAIHEVRSGEDPMANPFEKQRAEKQLLAARQKMREVRNKVEALGGKLRATVPDLTSPGAKRGKDGLREAIKRAQTSSASLGKFDRKAPNEATNIQPSRKKVTISSPSAEKERYMKFADRLFSGGSKVDEAKAAKVGASQFEGQKVARAAKGSKRRSKMGGRLHSKRK